MEFENLVSMHNIKDSIDNWCQHKNGGWVHNSSLIDPTAFIAYGVVIKAGASISAGTSIGAGVLIGEGVKIGDGVKISEGSSIGYNTSIGIGASISVGVKLINPTSIELVFDDWLKLGGKSASPEEYVELAHGDFHSGTVFDGTIELDEEQLEDFGNAIAKDFRPVFWIMVK